MQSQADEGERLEGGGYKPLAVVIETELEDVVDIRPGIPGMSASMLNLIEPYDDAR